MAKRDRHVNRAKHLAEKAQKAKQETHEEILAKSVKRGTAILKEERAAKQRKKTKSVMAWAAKVSTQNSFSAESSQAFVSAPQQERGKPFLSGYSETDLKEREYIREVMLARPEVRQAISAKLIAELSRR